MVQMYSGAFPGNITFTFVKGPTFIADDKKTYVNFINLGHRDGL